MKKHYFTKYSGAGNDFILFDKRKNPDLELTPDKVQFFCDRRNGIGADGILVVNKDAKYDFSLEYYNSDGYPGTLCGNGSRCAVSYAAFNDLLPGGKGSYICNGEVYYGESYDDFNVKVNLISPRDIRHNVKFGYEGYELTGTYVDIDSEHLVIEVAEFEKVFANIKAEIKNFPVFDLGRKIRYSHQFAPTGVNVNFLDVEKDHISIRTYERGVEDETLACGTGSVSAAVTAYLDGKLNPPIKLKTKSGEILEVNFNDENGDISNVTLYGPAKPVYFGEIFM